MKHFQQSAGVTHYLPQRLSVPKSCTKLYQEWEKLPFLENTSTTPMFMSSCNFYETYCTWRSGCKDELNWAELLRVPELLLVPRIYGSYGRKRTDDWGVRLTLYWLMQSTFNVKLRHYGETFNIQFPCCHLEYTGYNTLLREQTVFLFLIRGFWRSKLSWHFLIHYKIQKIN